MNARRSAALLVLLAPLLGVAACAYGSAYDPPRYASAAPAASVDPEIEPLPPSPKRYMRDPRGTFVLDAAAAALPAPSATPATSATAAPAASAVAAPSDGPRSTCGTKAEPCPMQRFMRGAMETAHTPDTLTAAFTRVAGMSPDPTWAWVAIATRGADLANAGDVRAAKGQCQACHDAYRSRYRALHRTRPL